MYLCPFKIGDGWSVEGLVEREGVGSENRKKGRKKGGGERKGGDIEMMDGHTKTDGQNDRLGREGER